MHVCTYSVFFRIARPVLNNKVTFEQRHEANKRTSPKGIQGKIIVSRGSS